MNYLWIILGHMAVACGIIGLFLPVMPTTPFLILASYCYSRGSPRFDAWLLNHAVLGPQVLAWRTHRVIKQRAKIVAGLMMTASLVWVTTRPRIPMIGKIATAIVMVSALGYVLTRRSQPPPVAGRIDS